MDVEYHDVGAGKLCGLRLLVLPIQGYDGDSRVDILPVLYGRTGICLAPESVFRRENLRNLYTYII